MALSPQLDAVHQLIVECHRQYFDESPSPNKLQKLCYYAQGFSLARGVELFPEDFEARQNGPTIRSLQEMYRGLLWRGIDRIWPSPPPEGPGFDTVREIVASYGLIDGAALTDMTHEQAPWLEARRGISEFDGCRDLISKESMRKAFWRDLPDED